MKTFVFWHPYLVFHLAPYIKELSFEKNCRVVVCAQEELPASYRARGYPIPDHGLASVLISPSSSEMGDLFSIKNSHHVFLGVRAFPMIKRAFQTSKKYEVRRYIMSENRDEPGFRSFLRMALYRFDAWIENGFVDGIFCIGAEGKKGGRVFFTEVGYPSEKIRSFRYVIEPRAQFSFVSNSDVKNFVYVGQLVHRKGIDLLLKAFSTIQDPLVNLTIVGSGSDKDKYMALAKNLYIENRVRWRGNLANEDVRKLISTCSVLVLPSRFDGWGAVVNEALSCGCPVICSDRCGAHELIEEGLNGFVFSIDDPNSLCEKMSRFVNHGVLWPQMTIAENSKKFGAEATMKLFLDGIDFFNGCRT